MLQITKHPRLGILKITGVVNFSHFFSLYQKQITIDSLSETPCIIHLTFVYFVTNKEVPEPPLYPESRRALAKKHSKLVDATPHAGKDGIGRM